MNGDIIIDSALSEELAFKQNPSFLCPPEILNRQRLVEVFYYSFDEKLHHGQIVVDKDLEGDVEDLFEFIRKIKFPVSSVIPVCDSKFLWDDELSMQKNNTSGFNYRTIARSDKLSNHAYGRAVDINPLINPYIRGDFIQPKGAVYDPSKKGALTGESQIVSYLRNKGWFWGGDWEGRKDYQHFEKI